MSHQPPQQVNWNVTTAAPFPVPTRNRPAPHGYPSCQIEAYWRNSSAAATELGHQGKCVALYISLAATTGMIDFGNESNL